MLLVLSVFLAWAIPTSMQAEVRAVLVGVLRTAGQESFAQVLTATADAMAQGGARQVLDGEDPMLSTSISGTALATQRHAIESGHVKAGVLQGLTEGTEVAFFAAPAGGALQGTAQLGSLATSFGSRLATVPANRLSCRGSISTQTTR